MFSICGGDTIFLPNKKGEDRKVAPEPNAASKSNDGENFECFDSVTSFLCYRRPEIRFCGILCVGGVDRVRRVVSRASHQRISKEPSTVPSAEIATLEKTEENEGQSG